MAFVLIKGKLAYGDNFIGHSRRGLAGCREEANLVQRLWQDLPWR